jgi:EmrB/QacA subfamily drug resistance transporter
MGTRVSGKVHEQQGREPSRLILPAIAIGTTLAPLNSTMIAIALPEIQETFDVSISSTAWLVTLYLVAMAIGQPVGGRLGDLYGRRRVYLLGLILFAVASAGCAFAPSLPWLIGFRTMQALSGALSFPNGAAMIRATIPEARRGVAFGIVGLAAASAAAAGPPIGGTLVHAWGWSAIFWANIPVIVLAFLLGWRSLPRESGWSTRRSRFDYAGTALFALALGSVIVIPSLIRFGYGWMGAVAAIASVGFGWLFIRSQVTAPSPVIDLKLFSQSHYAFACASICLSNLVMYTILLSLPLFLERVRDYGVQTTGLVLAAMSAFSALLGPLGGRWADQRGHWSPAVWGASTLAAGTVILTASTMVDRLALIVVALVIIGLGLGISGAPVQAAALQAIPGDLAGSAAGIFSTARYVGSVVGSSHCLGSLRAPGWPSGIRCPQHAPGQASPQFPHRQPCPAPARAVDPRCYRCASRTAWMNTSVNASPSTAVQTSIGRPVSDGSNDMTPFST